jgi:type II secretory pathway component PulK
MHRRDVRRARGLALLIVLVVLVIIATLATEIAITAKMHHTLSRHSMDDLLLRSAVDGRLEILKAALCYGRQDATSNITTEVDDWSWHNKEKLSSWGERGTSQFGQTSVEEGSGVSAYKNSDVQVVAWAEDERAKLNLLALTLKESDPTFKAVRAAAIRLIDVYRENWPDLDLTEAEGKEMVDGLVSWLHKDDADTNDNPKPKSKANRGRLQSVDDLVRVVSEDLLASGANWTAERLYDVKDPNATEDEEVPDDAISSSSSVEGDPNWERQNGVPGLARYLTVHADLADKAEGTALAQTSLQVNVNTASVVVLKALLEQNDEDLAEKIVERRRSGGTDESDSSSASTADDTVEDPTKSFFKDVSEISKVEGLEDFKADAESKLEGKRYWLLATLACVKSNVFSLRVIAKVSHGSSGGEEGGEDPNAPKTISRKDIDAVYDCRQVVQVVQAKMDGFRTLLTERRNDPIYDK